MSEGYSKTPLARKLGLKEGFKIILYNPPDHYWELFSDVPEYIEVIEEIPEEGLDFIHLFCTSLDELTGIAGKYKSGLKKNGLMWVSWPKGSSSITTDLKREPVREHLLDIGLVDIKVAAIDKDWSGLKFVYRKKDR